MSKPNSKRYRLRKDVLNYSTGHVISEGEIFEKIEVTKMYISKSGWRMSEGAILKEDWFEEINDRILVTSVGYNSNKEKGKDIITIETLPHNWGGYDHDFPTTEIWKKVEQVLNDEQPHPFLKQDAINQLLSEKPQPLSGELITLEECERREKKAFDCSRYLGKGYYHTESKLISYDVEFKTYEDYKQSLK
jgi:hypothetical protein